nr:NADH dehydrogenase subunit 4 [Cixiidae sp.]
MMYFLFLIPLCLFNCWYLFIYCCFFFFFFFFFFRCYDFYSLISCGFGLDTYSFGFCCLTIWICCLMMYSMNFYKNYLYSWFFTFNVNLILILLIICFMSLDCFNFYFFFESSILPVFFLILGWGYQPERLQSGYYLIFYTLFSSLPLLLCILSLTKSFGYFYFHFGYFNFNNLICFFLTFAFLVKFPMFFFHLWLPSAHVEAPVSGSMILAGVMLKLGGYGLIRMFLFLDLYILKSSYIFIGLSIFGSFFISMICLIQSDLKILIAYSSVSHMSLVISGLFTLSSFGYLGSYFLMIGHGLISSGLFYIVGCLYNRFGTRSMFILKGLLNFMPSFSLFMFLFCICNMSCPPSLNLFSEICIVISLFMWCKLTMFLLFFSLFFTACYSIMIFSITQHGQSSSLMKFSDGGLVHEFLIFSLHLIPFFLMMLNLFYFF